MSARNMCFYGDMKKMILEVVSSFFSLFKLFFVYLLACLYEGTAKTIAVTMVSASASAFVKVFFFFFRKKKLYLLTSPLDGSSLYTYPDVRY